VGTQAAVIGGEPAAELIARSAAGITGFKYVPADRP
jgi:hypothetical protein